MDDVGGAYLGLFKGTIIYDHFEGLVVVVNVFVVIHSLHLYLKGKMSDREVGFCCVVVDVPVSVVLQSVSLCKTVLFVGVFMIGLYGCGAGISIVEVIWN